MRKIAGTVVQPRNYVTSYSDVDDAMRLLDKAGLKPVQIEVERLQERIHRDDYTEAYL